jgi:polysaccharide biosynthesis/export protein
MQTIENKGYLTTPDARGRSVPDITPAAFQIANEINGFEHISYGTALLLNGGSRGAARPLGCRRAAAAESLENGLLRSTPARRGLTCTVIRLAGLFALLAAGEVIAKEPPRFSAPPPDLRPLTTAAGGQVGPVSSVTASNVTSVGSTNSMDALDDKHRLAIGDRLSFRIVEDEEDPKPLFVTDSGDLEVPYLGRFPAAERTCKELARALKAELEKEYYYEATVVIAVDLMAKSRGKVYLVGPVRMPGPQEIPSDEVLTLSKAVLRAGGFNDYADKHKVKVTRRTAGGPDKTFMIDVGEVLEKGRTESDLPLEAGDLIYVPERLIRF